MIFNFNFIEFTFSNRELIFGETKLEPVSITEEGFNYLDILSPTEHPVKRSKDLSNAKFWNDLLPLI